jgi:hypothetical protein
LVAAVPKLVQKPQASSDCSLLTRNGSRGPVRPYSGVELVAVTAEG